MAVTINSQNRTVFGNKRALLVNLDVGADADTWNTGLTTVDYFGLTVAADGSTVPGGTASGGTITFQTGGAMTGLQLLVIGI